MGNLCSTFTNNIYICLKHNYLFIILLHLSLYFLPSKNYLVKFVLLPPSNKWENWVLVLGLNPRTHRSLTGYIALIKLHTLAVLLPVLWVSMHATCGHPVTVLAPNNPSENKYCTVDHWTTWVWTTWAHLAMDFFPTNTLKKFLEICDNLKNSQKNLMILITFSIL